MTAMAADIVEQGDGARGIAHGEKRHTQKIDRPCVSWLGKVACESDTGPARGKQHLTFQGEKIRTGIDLVGHADGVLDRLIDRAERFFEGGG